jgi:site-specific DNA-methyltransferase (adenine-specific)
MKRHKELRSGIDPFRKNGDTPKAKNSRVKRLPKQKYEVSKKTLQLDIKRIADILGKIPTKEEVKINSQYPINFYEEYFIDWGEACAAARTTGMSETKEPISKKIDSGEQLNIFSVNKAMP